jgi:D-beta-D-heptose 7-phosphate kinase/D-beta-D-heptose 1-phosphate adenosyltransferase
VDYVVVFDEDTPLELIKLIKPDSLIKGSDYDKSDIIGADIVEKKGGRVIIVELLDNYSTSSIIDSFEK